MTQIKLRRDTSAAFASSNPILGNGEPAYETDTKKLKIGDGTTAYTQLEYFSAGGGGSTDISATLPLKIVNGVISLEVDGQTIQVVDGKLTASANMVTTNTTQTITGNKTFRYIGIDDAYGGKTRLGDGQSKIEMAYDGQISLDSATILADQSQNWRVGRYNKAGLIYSASPLKRVGDGPTFTDYDILDSSNLASYVDGTTITYTNNKLSATGGSSEPPANMVTTDTAQTITGQKEFNHTILSLNQDLIRGQQSTSYRNGAGLSMGSNSTSTDGGVFAPQWRIYNTQGGVDRTETIMTTYNQSKLNDSNFNAASKLVRLDSSGKLPAIDGSQLTNLPSGSSEPPANMVTTDTAQTITGTKTFGGTDLSKILLEGSKSLIGFRANADSLPTTLIGGFFDSNGKKSITIGSTDHETLSLNAKSVQDGSGNKFLTSGNVAAYVTEEFVDGTEGYRIWSNGRCEQWGVFSSGSQISGKYEYTVTLLQPYKDANYQAYITPIVLGAGESTIGVLATGRTTTQFKCGSLTQYTKGCLWKTEGYIA